MANKANIDDCIITRERNDTLGIAYALTSQVKRFRVRTCYI